MLTGKYFLLGWSIVVLSAVGVLPSWADTIFLVNPKANQEQATPQETFAEVQLKKGLASLIQGDLKAAEAALRESLKLKPDQVSALVGLADVNVRKGQKNEAAEYLQKALTLAPQNPAVQRSWGRYLASQKRFGEAEAAFKKAISLNPGSAALAQVELGDLYLAGMNNPAKAIPAYRAAISLDPRVPGAHYSLGMALGSSGETAKAEGEFQEAGRQEPGNPMPLQALAVLYLQRRELDKALQSFSEALKVQPEFIPAHMGRGEVFEATGKDASALAEYSAVLKVGPKFAPAYVKIGVIHQRHNRAAEAKQAYLSAIGIDPSQVIAYNNLAFEAAERRVNLDEAVTWAKKAVSLQPQIAQFQDTLGWVYRARGELDQAALALNKAVSLNPSDPDVFYHLGLVYAEAGKNREAATALKKALDLKPDFPASADARRRLVQLGKQ